MKLNKKNKGKVHPSPPSSSSPPLLHPTSSKDAVSALRLLPAAILTLITVLTPDEREVLAYLITRSIKATENLSLLLQENSRRRTSSKRTPSSTAEHKHPLFDCGCFDCYTSYWFRWDSSPNRELIHQAIEAFEEHLATGERSSKKTGKRRDKIGGVSQSGDSQMEVPESSTAADGGALADSPAEEAADSPGPAAEELPEAVDDGSVEEANNEASSDEWEAARTVVAGGGGGGGNHKGLARKVLPDVIGLFNSRLWSLWSPNV